MPKGLPRSLSRGHALKKPIINKTIRVNTLVTATAAATGVGFGNVALAAFPEGNVLFLGAVANLRVSALGANATNAIAAFNGDYSIGSGADADGTLSGADVNLVAPTALGPAVARVTPFARGTGATQTVLDNTARTLNMNLNVLVDAADITDATSVTLTVEGTLDIAYVMLGDD